MHVVADVIEAATSIPLLHIADATAEAIGRDGLRHVGLLGTGFTMEADFYRGRLEQHGLDITVPDKDDRELVHRVIYCVVWINDLGPIVPCRRRSLLSR